MAFGHVCSSVYQSPTSMHFICVCIQWRWAFFWGERHNRNKQSKWYLKLNAFVKITIFSIPLVNCMHSCYSKSTMNIAFYYWLKLSACSCFYIIFQFFKRFRFFFHSNDVVRYDYCELVDFYGLVDFLTYINFILQNDWLLLLLL